MEPLDVYGVRYHNNLDDFKPEIIPVKCISLVEFYRLKSRKIKYTSTSIEMNTYLTAIIYSPYSDRYYIRDIYPHFDTKWLKSLKKYLVDGCLYIGFNEAEGAKFKEKIAKSGLSRKKYVRLIELELALDSLDSFKNESPDYMTKRKQISDEIREIKNNKSHE